MGDELVGVVEELKLDVDSCFTTVIASLVRVTVVTSSVGV